MTLTFQDLSTKLPDGPQGLPLVEFIKFMTDQVGYMETCCQRYGDIFTLPFNTKPGFSPMVVVGNSQAIKTIYTAGFKAFDFPEKLTSLKCLLGEYSLLYLDKERARQQHELLMPPLHGVALNSYGNDICQITKQVSSGWIIDQPLSIQPMMQDITLQAIIKIIFGINQEQRYQQIRQLLTRWLENIESGFMNVIFLVKFLQKDLGFLTPWRNFVHLREQIDQLIYTEIQQRRSQPNQQVRDILSLFMSAHDQQGQTMTDQQLRDQTITLLIGGHETTTNALTWAFYRVLSHPEIYSTLQEEIDSLEENPDPMTIANLPYLNAVCQEVLRIDPIGLIHFPRVLQIPLQIGEYQFQPGTELCICSHLAHQREELYPQPQQFRPERFLERKYTPYEYLPFGGGEKRCPGNALAVFEMKLILATILSNFQLKLLTQQAVKATSTGLAHGPNIDLKMMVTAKKSRIQ